MPDDSKEPPKPRMEFQGEFRGHSGWVTKIAVNPLRKDMLMTSSRDKTLLVWKLGYIDDYIDDLVLTVKPHKSLLGHGHFVSDVAISHDGNHALSASWDKTLRLWDLNTAQSPRQFIDHKKDVLSVAFSPDSRQIISGSRDKTIKLWNTLAQCKHTITPAVGPLKEEAHTDWVSSVGFQPGSKNPVVVSASWDKVVKVWDLNNCRLKATHLGHTGYINSTTISPDGTICASGGKDGSAMVWGLNTDEDQNNSKHLFTLPGQDVINVAAFATDQYWLCTAVGSVVKIWDLEPKRVAHELKLENSTDPKASPQCTALAWSTDGKTLFVGATDGMIRVWRVVRPGQI